MYSFCLLYDRLLHKKFMHTPLIQKFSDYFPLSMVVTAWTVGMLYLLFAVFNLIWLVQLIIYSLLYYTVIFIFVHILYRSIFPFLNFSHFCFIAWWKVCILNTKLHLVDHIRYSYNKCHAHVLDVITIYIHVLVRYYDVTMNSSILHTSNCLCPVVINGREKKSIWLAKFSSIKISYTSRRRPLLINVCGQLYTLQKKRYFAGCSL